MQTKTKRLTKKAQKEEEFNAVKKLLNRRVMVQRGLMAQALIDLDQSVAEKSFWDFHKAAIRKIRAQEKLKKLRKELSDLNDPNGLL